MPIVFAELNKEVKIVKLLVDEDTRKHLQNLGIFVGATIKVISSTFGNLILAIKESRLAINKDVAAKILVA